jgi:hypothetical protein
MKYLLLLLLLLGGCATMNPSISGSAAPRSVQRDIGHLLVYVDANKAPECKERRHIAASLLRSDKPGTTIERWAVTRCGTTKYYIITFTPTPQRGGHDFTFKEEL